VDRPAHVCFPKGGGATWTPDKSAMWVLLLGLLLSACTPYGTSVSVETPPHVEGAALTESPGEIARGTPLHEDRAMAKHQEDTPPAPPELRGGPLTVDQAIEEALKASPELVQIRQRVAASTEQVRQAESAFYPKLAMVEEYNNTNNPVYALMNIINQRRFRQTINFNDPGAQQNYSSRIQAEWSLFEGGSRLHDLKAAGWYKNSTDAELASARNQLVAKVTETYYRWLQAISYVGVAERVLESAQMDEKLGEARLKVEMALPSEAMRLKARTAEARGNLLSARTGARRFQAGIERLIARPVGPEEIPQQPPVFAPSSLAPPVDSPDSLVRLALEQRPEMAAARALILAARERVESAKGGFLPKIGTNFRYEWNTENFSRNADSWLVGVQATWPIFEGGITLSRLRESKLRLKEMESRGEQAALDISLEVTQAALAVEEALEKVNVAEERKKWAELALREVQHQYRDETAGVDSLLQAEASWSQAEVAYASALFDAQISRALLRQSLGDFAGSMEARSE